MPQKKKTGKVNSVDELLEIAKVNYGELVKPTLESMKVENLGLDAGISLADFVEKRFIGMNMNNIQAEHDINGTERRLEHVEDSPRKEAARIITEKYRECYENVTDLRIRQHVLAEAQKLVQEKTYVLEPEKRRELDRLDAERRAILDHETAKLTVYQNFWASFFQERAVFAIRPDQQVADFEMEAEREVLGEIAAALPQGQEYDAYRTRAGYEEKQPLPMAPRAAVMVMNPNVITDITVEDFPASIRADKPSRANLEWGASTFDNMLESLYNKDEWKMLAADKKDLLKTVYLDGKPIVDVFQERKHGEEYEDYAKRIKSELVARALEGKGKIDVVPYRRVDGAYSFGDPVPVHVKVNIKEKVSAWKRFLRFFNVKIELKKEKAERLSVEDLNGEERREEIRRDTQRIAARENTSYHVRQKVEAAQASTNCAQHDFFGHVVPRRRQTMAPALEARYFDDISKAVRARVNGKISPEDAELIGMSGMKTAAVIQTLDRSETRLSMVRLYALSKGMSMKDVLSTDPELRERKEQIGREFMDLVSIKGSEEFRAENGPDADYKAYFADKSQKVYDMLKDMHHTLAEIPLDYFHGSSPEELAERYEEISFVATASQDLFQCCPKHVKALNFNELDAMEKQVRSVGELRGVVDYCRDYVATDSYAKSNLAEPQENRTLVEAMYNKMRSEMLVKDTAGITKLGDLHQNVDEAWTGKTTSLRIALSMKMSDPQVMNELVDHLEKDGKPVYYFDEKVHEFAVDTAEHVQQMEVQRQQAREQQGPVKREAVSMKELDDVKKKPALKPLEKQKTAQKAPMQKKGPQLD